MVKIFCASCHLDHSENVSDPFQQTPFNMYRELTALGAKPDITRTVAANSRRWWRNSGLLLNAVLTLAWFNQLGVPSLS